VVLIPGIMGTELYLDGKLIWPGSVRELLAPYGKMDQLLDERTCTGNILRSVAVKSLYGALIDDLNRWMFSEKSTLPNLYLFPYDWRRSNCDTAFGLASLLDKAFDDHSGQLQVSLVAHSMGGLIARYYLEGGRFNGNRGYSAVRHLFTLATPHRGAPMALAAALGQESQEFLNKEQVARLANDDRYPSVYQLLPPEGEPFVWNDGPTAEYQPRNVYDPPLAARLKLTANNLDKAKELHRGLDLNRRPPAVRYFFFVGTQHKTASSFYLQGQSPDEARSVEVDQSGDGTVPIWSGAVTGVQGLAVGGSHAVIYKNRRLRTTLAGLLGVPARLGAAIPKVEVSIRDQVVESGAELHLTLEFPEKIRNIAAILSFQELTDSGKPKADSRPGSGQVFRYSGVAVDSIGVVLTVPDQAGFYRVIVRDSKSKKDLGSDELIVQATSQSAPSKAKKAAKASMGVLKKASKKTAPPRRAKKRSSGR